jgi:hypothetical protein
MYIYKRFSQAELTEIRRIWNVHRIRPTNYTGGGRPIMLYDIPELYGTRDYMCDVDLNRIDVCAQECTFYNGIPCDEDIYPLACLYMDEHGWLMPSDPYEAVDLYVSLRDCFRMHILCNGMK